MIFSSFVLTLIKCYFKTNTGTLGTGSYVVKKKKILNSSMLLFIGAGAEAGASEKRSLEPVKNGSAPQH